MDNETKLRDYLRRVTLELHKARAQLEQRVSSENEPIAIVGMTCRFPGGVRSGEQLWELLENGRDAISEFPEGRGWDLEALYDPDPDKKGTTTVCRGGFLHEVAEFDPTFFGISPRE